MRGNEDPGFERSALCNLTHASYVHASWRNRKKHQPVILHHHREALSNALQHRHPVTSCHSTLAGKRVTLQVYMPSLDTPLPVSLRPPANVTFLLQTGVRATTPSPLVGPE